MFKNIITACAGLVLSSGFAFGVDVSGQYSGQSNGQSLSVTLSSQGGMVRGQVAVGGGNLPLVGREMNGQIQGIWQSPDGQDIPFAAVMGPNGLQIQTNGMTYSLSRSSAASQLAGPLDSQNGGQLAPVQQQADPAVGGNMQAAPVGQGRLETHQGRVMQADLPAGWSFSDTTNGMDSAAPDGITAVSHTWLRGVGQCNPDMYLQQNMQMWGQWGITNVQLISAKDVNAQAKLYEFQYMSHGRPAHTLIQISVTPAAESYMAEMVFIQTAPETFQQSVPMLIGIARSVRVLDNNAFCDNGKINGEIQKRYAIRAQTARDVAAIQQSGYEYRSHVQDQMNLQSSDTRRDQNRFDDGSGNQYTAPLESQRMFKHADGSLSYSTNSYDPVPSDATELTPHAYR